MIVRTTMATVVAAAALAGVMAAPAGAATDVVRWGSVSGWDVLIDVTLDNGCFIYTTYDGGTALRLGISPSDDAAYIMIGNSKWGSIQDGRDYNIQIKMDRDSPWYVTATGFDFEGLPMLMAIADDPDFLVDFALKNTLQLTYAGQVAATLSLKGTYAAMNELFDCQDQVDRIGVRGHTDPFAR